MRDTTHTDKRYKVSSRKRMKNTYAEERISNEPIKNSEVNEIYVPPLSGQFQQPVPTYPI